MQPPYQAIIPAPFGAVGVRVEHGALTRLELLSGDVSPILPGDAFAQNVCNCIAEYLKDATVSLDLPLEMRGTPFQQRVWEALRTIPLGESLTYGELAKQVSSGPRAVANACGANPFPLLIPCHRVVAKHGIGGFMQGRDQSALSIKQWLLKHERRNPSSAG